MGVTVFLVYAEGIDPDAAFATARADAVRDHAGRGFSALLAPDATYTIVDEIPTGMDTACRRAADLLLSRGDNQPAALNAIAIRGGTRSATITLAHNPDGWDSVADAVHTTVPLTEGETIQGTPSGDYTTDEHTQRVTGGTVTVTVAGGAAHTGWLFFGGSPT